MDGGSPTDPAPVATIVSQVALGQTDVFSMPVEALVATCEGLNAAYRRGHPLVSDAEYDSIFLSALRQRAPEHPFFMEPEPEPDDLDGDRVRHRLPMLSTDKVKTTAEARAWVSRLRKAATEIGLDPSQLMIRVTPKLDGNAGVLYDDLAMPQLLSRGRNGYGRDLSHLLRLGVVCAEPLKAGPGEVVVDQAYFDGHLAPTYGLEHPRNFIAGLAGSDEIEAYHRDALDAGKVRFEQYSDMAGTEVSIGVFADNWELVMLEVQKDVPYLCDGAVAEITDQALRNHLGSTSSFHRWQAALKRDDEMAETEVLDCELSTGRTGRVAPTLVLNPVSLYGVTISRVTAHTADHLETLGLGKGAVVRIVRSGGVIPHIVGVKRRAAEPAVISHCPSCGTAVEQDGAYRVCPNTAGCPAQASRAIEHHFSIVGIARGFGPSVCEKLADAGITRLDAIYQMDAAAFEAAGVSPGIAKNLVDEMSRSRRSPIAPALLLGSMGVRHLGRGDSKRLLAVIPIERLGELTPEIVATAEGFGTITSAPVAAGVAKIWPQLKALLELGFTFEAPIAASSSSPVSGAVVVFTGTMTSGSRADMEAQATRLGAKVGSSVSAKTTYLVCGEKVGASKTDKAKKMGVTCLTELEWLGMIEGNDQ